MSEEERLEIIEKITKENKKKKQKPTLKYGTIVFCRGNNGAGSFYGIVYNNGILELPYGSDAYIQTTRIFAFRRYNKSLDY